MQLPTSTRRRLAGAVVVVATAVLSVVPVAAKEIGSGGGTVTSTACNPVTSLKYRGDARVGETGLASIDVSYGVRSCTKDAVTADVVVFENANPSVVLWDQPNAPLNAAFTVFGVRTNTSYIVKVTVRDAATGTVVGSQQIFAAAVRKVGV